ITILRVAEAIREFNSGRKIGARELRNGFSQPLRDRDAKYRTERIHEGGLLMARARRGRRRWRTPKSKWRSQPSSKGSEGWRPKIMNGGESAEAEETDRLLLSSLRYWGVEADLMEERLGAGGG